MSITEEYEMMEKTEMITSDKARHKIGVRDTTSISDQFNMSDNREQFVNIIKDTMSTEEQYYMMEKILMITSG